MARSLPLSVRVLAGPGINVVAPGLTKGETVELVVLRSAAETLAARDSRWEDCFGSVDSATPDGADNGALDRDLQRAYAGQAPDPR
jgi:hypothetical protein